MLTRRIREAVDIVDVIGSYMTLRRAGNAFKGLCPFHEEKTPSFTVSPARQTYKCFGCGAGGDVFSFLQAKENVDFPEARRLLAERSGISLEEERRGPSDGPGKVDLIRVNNWALLLFRRNFQDATGAEARAYVEKRGISSEMVESFGLGLAVDSFDSLLRRAASSGIETRLLAAAGLIKAREAGGYYDTFRHRLMFPITDALGRCVGFGGRTMGDDPAKYLNTPATALFDKSRNLFGLDRARQMAREAGRIIVVEGYTDCIMAHQFGFTETVATLGTAMTEAHARMLKRYTDRLVLLFDSDEAGQRAADRALSVTLTVGLDVSLARVPEGKDPCDYLLSAGKDGLESVLNHASGALEFKWQQVAAQYDASATGAGRLRALEAYLQEVASWLGAGAIDPIQTGLLVNQLGQIVSVPAEELHRRLRAMAKRMSSRARRTDAASGSPASAGETEIRGARQHAFRQIVEVLLNAPERYAEVEDLLDPSQIRDAALSAVAEALIEMLGSGEPFRIDELIGRFESPTFGRLITDLQSRGERRGDFEKDVEEVRACLASTEQSRQAARLVELIRQPPREEAGSAADDSKVDSENERLAALSASAKQTHFASAKARRRYLDV